MTVCYLVYRSSVLSYKFISRIFLFKLVVFKSLTLTKLSTGRKINWELMSENQEAITS